MLSEEYFYTDYRPGDPLPIPDTIEEEEMVVEKAVFDLRAGKQIHPYLREVIRENNLCPDIEYEEECAREEELEEECQFYIDNNEPIPDYIVDMLPEYIKDTLPSWAINGEKPPERPPLRMNNPSNTSPSNYQPIHSATPPPYTYIPAGAPSNPSQSHWQAPKDISSNNPYVSRGNVSAESIPVQSNPQMNSNPSMEGQNPHREVTPLKEVVILTDPIDPNKKF